MIEQLESRRHFDAAVTGGPGHAGFAVDVWDRANPTTKVAGVFSMDYYAQGYFGDDEPKDTLGAVLWGAQGKFYWEYHAGSSIHDKTFGQHGVGTLSGNTLARTQAADFTVLLAMTDVVDAPDAFQVYDFANAKQSVHGRQLARNHSGWESYVVWGGNCYTFSYFCAAKYAYSVGKGYRYDQLCNYYDRLIEDISLALDGGGGGGGDVTNSQSPSSPTATAVVADNTQDRYAYTVEAQTPPEVVGGWGPDGNFWWTDGWSVWRAIKPPGPYSAF